MTLPPPIPSPARPVLVSVISGYYLISFILAGLSLWLTYSGLIPIPPSQRAYLDSLTWEDHAFTFSIMLIKLAGATALFFLRRVAVYLFAFGLFASVCSIIYRMLTKNYQHAIGAIAISGVVVGWVISTVIIIYAGNLAKNRILR